MAVEALVKATVAGFLIAIFVSQGVNHFWGMINAQQILLLIPLFDVSKPGSFQEVFTSLMTILNLEIYNIGEDLEQVFKIRPSIPDDDISYMCEQIGYDSTNIIANEGNTIVLLILYLLNICLYFLNQSLYFE